MDKVKIGIPRGLFYYYHGFFLKKFFEYLNFEVIVSPNTNKEIMEKGSFVANDEMCLSLKTFLGHVMYLEDKCDFLLIMRLDNYGRGNQMCSNFSALYDLVSHLSSVPVIDINIDWNGGYTLYEGLKAFCKRFHVSRREMKDAYLYASVFEAKEKKKRRISNLNRLSMEGLKVLVVAHPYNLYDAYIGKPILSYLEENHVQVIFCDAFDYKKTNLFSKYYSKTLYWKYSKENIGSIVFCKDKIDGVIFISSFPCGPDSLVNELVMRKMDKPYLSIVVDELDSLTGIETRLESFIDILEQKVS